MAHRFLLCGADPLRSYTFTFPLAFTLFLTHLTTSTRGHLYIMQHRHWCRSSNSRNRHEASADSSYNATSAADALRDVPLHLHAGLLPRVARGSGLVVLDARPHASAQTSWTGYWVRFQSGVCTPAPTLEISPPAPARQKLVRGSMATSTSFPAPMGMGRERARLGDTRRRSPSWSSHISALRWRGLAEEGERAAFSLELLEALLDARPHASAQTPWVGYKARLQPDNAKLVQGSMATSTSFPAPMGMGWGRTRLGAIRRRSPSLSSHISALRSRGLAEDGERAVPISHQQQHPPLPLAAVLRHRDPSPYRTISESRASSDSASTSDRIGVHVAPGIGAAWDGDVFPRGRSEVSLIPAHPYCASHAAHRPSHAACRTSHVARRTSHARSPPILPVEPCDEDVFPPGRACRGAASAGDGHHSSFTIDACEDELIYLVPVEGGVSAGMGASDSASTRSGAHRTLCAASSSPLHCVVRTLAVEDMAPAYRSSFSVRGVNTENDGNGRVLCLRVDSGWHALRALRRFLLTRIVCAFPVVCELTPLHGGCSSPPRTHAGTGAAMPRTSLRFLLTSASRRVAAHRSQPPARAHPRPQIACIARHCTRAFSLLRLMVMLDQTDRASGIVCAFPLQGERAAIHT
ncbi:hypothetical protein B0H19DRAFT_1253997 [Mycena capillaripes]|nr:hypothetical protein B0H19DRAFT_1253997 [Mycena capillaripes]